MKSQTSWVKLARRLFSRQAWVFALSCAAAFLVWPVLLLFARSQLQEQYAQTAARLPMARFITLSLADQYRGVAGALIVLAMEGVAVLAAWQGFSALHSREKTDLLHSFPVRRERWFRIRAGVAAFDLLAPSLAGFLAAAGAAALRGVWSPELAGAMAHALSVSLAYGFLSYAAAALAMLLTGQLLVGALGTAVFFGAGPLSAAMLYLYKTSFFDTFRSLTGFFGSAGFTATSPVTAGLSALTRGAGAAAAGLIAALLLLAAGEAVYRARPSEAAGRAMAFGKAAAVITALLTALGALGGGIFLRAAQGAGTDAWFLFGLVFFLLLTFAAVRMIVVQDFSSVFRARKTLAAAALAVCAFAAFFRFDLAGFDSRLPAMQDVESIAFLPGAEYADQDTSIPWQSRLANAGLGCDEALYGLLSRMAHEHLSKSEEKTVGNYGIGSAPFITARVTLKNGRSYLRRYCMRFSDIAEDWAALYGREAYLDALYPVRGLDPARMGELLFVARDGRNTHFDGGEAHPEIARLLLAMARESAALTPEEIRTASPAGKATAWLDLTGRGPETRDGYGESLVAKAQEETRDPFVWRVTMYVWPSMKETLSILAEMGCPADGMLTPDSVRGVTLFSRDEDGTLLSMREVTDEAERASLVPRLRAWDQVTAWMPVVPGEEAQAEYRTESGYLETNGYVLLEP